MMNIYAFCLLLSHACEVQLFSAVLAFNIDAIVYSAFVDRSPTIDYTSETPPF